MSALRRRSAALLVGLAVAGCELKEVSLTEPERVVIAEAYARVSLGPPPPGSGLSPDLSVFLHETLGPTGKSPAVPGARITVTRAGGASIALAERPIAECAISLPVDQTGTCYGADAAAASSIVPGDRLALRIELADGGVMTAETVVPGAFRLLGVDDGLTCTVTPLTATQLSWTRSDGAWAYLADTSIRGLAASFDTTKVEIEDPLYLFGLSVAARDTTIVFPGEFGVFSRADLDFEVSSLLQKGLPDGVGATVSVGAVDRNWVNWARGGNFNPSGVVRVPSVRGDGTGVFGSGVLRTFDVLAGAGTVGAPRCPPPPAP